MLIQEKRPGPFVALFVLSILLAGPGKALAVGNVYLQNNTPYQFSVETIQSGHHQLTRGEHWNQSASGLHPWQKEKKLLWYNRNEGITSGKSFYFDTSIGTEEGQLAVLRQKLTGTWRFSRLYFSLNGAGYAHDWFQGDTIRHQTFELYGKRFEIKYRARYNMGTASDDVVYVIHQADPFPLSTSEDNPSGFSVLAYNIYTVLTQTAADINRRVSHLPAALSGYDAIFFSEAFYNPARESLKAAVSQEYPYTTAILDKSGYLEDGGVFIASRWPIELEDQEVYSSCSGVDCLSPKGAVYARVNKAGTRYHLFATHTQAGESDAAVSVRKSQFRQLRQFVSSFSIAQDKAVILGGDMNVNKLSRTDEYEVMCDLLGVAEPPKVSAGFDFSYDPLTNAMASGSRQYLDYLFYATDYRVPSLSQNRVLVLRSAANGMFGTWDYSDHYPVHGFFDYN